ncbi:MAG: D-glycerate dehydrogenase [Chloroflexota bacterium]
MKPKVFITRAIPEAGLDLLRPIAEIEVWEDELPPPRESLLQKVKGVEALLTLLTDKIDSQVMDAAGASLKVISQMAVGYDNIDVTAATARKIPVGHTPGVLTETTADFTWALLMSAARRIVEGDNYTRDGKWKTWMPTLLLGPDVHRATLGIIGLGRIGQAVAKRAKGFDMRVIYRSAHRHPEIEKSLGVEYVPLDSLYAESDFISIHTPLNDSTYHLINDSALAKMKPGAILINTARGGVIDPDALHRALRDKKIAYAALDVTEPEPIPLESPLLTLDNIIIAPHIASASIQTRNKMATMAAENLIAGLKGEKLPHCVNPQVYR